MNLLEIVPHLEHRTVDKVTYKGKSPPYVMIQFVPEFVFETSKFPAVASMFSAKAKPTIFNVREAHSDLFHNHIVPALSRVKGTHCYYMVMTFSDHEEVVVKHNKKKSVEIFDYDKVVAIKMQLLKSSREWAAHWATALRCYPRSGVDYGETYEVNTKMMMWEETSPFVTSAYTTLYRLGREGVAMNMSNVGDVRGKTYERTKRSLLQYS